MCNTEIMTYFQGKRFILTTICVEQSKLCNNTIHWLRACTLISSAYGRKRKGVKCAKSLYSIYILLSILNVYKADSRRVVRNIPSFFLGIAVLASDFIRLILNNYLLYLCRCFIIENEFNFFWILSSPSSPRLIYEGVDRLTTVSRADYSGKSHRIIN